VIRRIVLPLLAVLLVLGTAGGAALYTQRTVDNADRAVEPDLGLERVPERTPDLEPNRGSSHTELSAVLLPVPAGYALGPDLGDYGNDTEISGEEATALLVDGAASWPRDYREELEDGLAEADLQGVAMRSYAPADPNVAFRPSVLVTITLTQFGSDEWAEAEHSSLRESLSEDELFPPGPELADYPEAACAHLPRGDDWLRFMGLDPDDFASEGGEEGEELDRMVCTAAVGPYHVLADIQGADPLRKRPATQIFKDQLDHIESPGMSI
jgi:hypothetical protein